jgi:hypothetical protein
MNCREIAKRQGGVASRTALMHIVGRFAFGPTEQERDNFLILTFFSKLFLKITPQKHYLQI